MSDRRAVTAGRLTPSVAGEMWRVAVGGNRVENMTVAEIAQAYHAGHLSERTPLWPPGTSGWQALGNFEQFQYAPGAQDPMAAGHNQYQQLAQFQESDDDPTRMWTGASDLEMAMPAPMPVAPSAPPARPSSRTGPRQVASQPAPRPMPMASVRPQQRVVSSVASPSAPPVRARRSSGWLLVAGLVGLVGLGSAVLAARGNWSSAAAEAPPAVPEAAAAAAAAPAATENGAAAPAGATAAAAEPSAPGVNDVAKYEENGASAFVAGGEPNKAGEADKAAEPVAAEGQADLTQAAEAASATKAEGEGEGALASAPEKGKRTSRTAAKEGGSKAASAPKRSISSKVSASTSNAKRATAPLASKPKPEPSEDAAPTPAGPSVNEAAATALANSAKLASSCRPRGGPSGPGKARVIYSQDGEVQSVEILTAKFRDTLTGSCVRMVFRRAKIPPFKGEPPTFIKSFTIPEE